MDSAGHNMFASTLNCLEMLSTKEKKWNYVIVLQNHDIPLRTPREMVQVLKWFNGANDMKGGPPSVGRISNETSNLDWSFEGLMLFRNGGC